MLTIEEIGAHLERLTYKPGWHFAAYQGRWEGHHLAITAIVEDSYHQGEKVVLDVHCFLPPLRDTRALEDWLMWRLARIEVHEMREFFKRDGVVVDSPHKKDADRDLG